ncbi:MAG: hypothetical protein FJ051_03330 [Cyanobacteria bacterium M_surface_9_m1_291]|nr:hypothetical protein [Cyanobacteria bacterium K_Offshore_0m_m2_072]MBM5808840.1 hypothetical protein [Cyanobacteria bacterium M_surface_9_m1_291]
MSFAPVHPPLPPPTLARIRRAEPIDSALTTQGRQTPQHHRKNRPLGSTSGHHHDLLIGPAAMP